MNDNTLSEWYTQCEKIITFFMNVNVIDNLNYISVANKFPSQNTRFDVDVVISFPFSSKQN